MLVLINGWDPALAYFRNYGIYASSQIPFPSDCTVDDFITHREITPTELSGPRFHAPLHNFTPPPGPAGGLSRTTGADCSGRTRWRYLMLILLILVLEIPFNFQFDMQCAGNANSNVSFQVNASFEQILFLRHTWVRSKGLRTIGS